MQVQIFIGVLLLSALYLFQEKRLPWIIKICWAYFALMSGLLAYRPDYVPAVAPLLKDVMANSAAKCFFQIVAFPLIVMLLSEKSERALIWLMRLFAIADGVLLITGNYRGLIEATTFDGTILALLIPLWFEKNKLNYFAIMFSLFGILYVKTRAGGLALAIILAVYLWPYVKSFPKRKLYLTVFSVLILGVCFEFWYYPKFISDERILIWSRALNWWDFYIGPWGGAGMGSFEWLGPMVDIGRGDNRIYILHNDWLQTLFECGIIGISLLVVSYTYVLFKIKDIADRATWLALGAAMCLYYPLHAFIIQIYGLMIIKRALLTNERGKNEIFIRVYNTVCNCLVGANHKYCRRYYNHFTRCFRRGTNSNG